MNEQRAKDFLSCLGNGKSIYECESENEMIEEELMKPKKLLSITVGQLNQLKDLGYLSKKGLEFIKYIEIGNEEDEVEE
jgi:hypothetical protein